MQLLEQAIMLMTHGMGMVFLFLALMLLCVQAMSRILLLFPTAPPSPLETSDAEEERRRAALLGAAIHHQRRGQAAGTKEQP